MNFRAFFFISLWCSEKRFPISGIKSNNLNTLKERTLVVACDAYVCAWNAFFLKSRLIPGDEATASNGKGVKEGTRQGKGEERWWSFSCGRADNSSSAKCSGQTNSQLKFRLHGEHTCISCNTTIVHRRHAQAGVWNGWLGLGTRRSVAYDQPSRIISAVSGGSFAPSTRLNLASRDIVIVESPFAFIAVDSGSPKTSFASVWVTRDYVTIWNARIGEIYWHQSADLIIDIGKISRDAVSICVSPAWTFDKIRMIN